MKDRVEMLVRRIWAADWGTPEMLDAVEELLDLVPLDQVDQVLRMRDAIGEFDPTPIILDPTPIPEVPDDCENETSDEAA